MLHLPCQKNSKPIGENKPHGTAIRRLLNQRSMRALGRAHDKGIIKEAEGE